jgi:Holliday junction resolvasome RuvABC endonuclease subunit
MVMAVNFIAIDPGSRLMGVSLITMSDDLSIVEEVISSTLTATSGVDARLKKSHDKRFARLQLLKEKLYEFIGVRAVDFATTEGAFANHKRPGAVIPLVLAIAMYTDVMYDLFPSVYVKWISPSEIKNAVSVSGTANKVGMDVGIVTELDKLGYTLDISSYSEHAVDATAANIARIKMVQQTINQKE